MAEELRILAGRCLFYRLLDLAEHVDLALVQERLGARRPTTRYNTRREGFVLRTPPLEIPLEELAVELGESKLRVRASAKLWDYGVASFRFELRIPEGTPVQELTTLARPAIRGFELEKLAREHAKELASAIADALVSPHDWEVVERFTVYLVEELAAGPEGPMPATALLEADLLPALLLNERPGRISQLLRSRMLARVHQFGVDDLALIDANSAIVVDPGGALDLPDLLEFARAQLMELRYYDGLIGRHLGTLYQSIKGRHGLFRSRFAGLSKEASARFIELSELVERLESSIKMAGDVYVAGVFQDAAEQFRLPQWKESVVEKLALLGRLSELLQGELNTLRSHLLEIIVVLLILVEIIQTFVGRH